jgi:hypothetical protein
MTAIRPLDPDVLNEAIPAFFIGRNAEGFWIARERNGATGGLFLLKSSAISFAHRHAGDVACATIFPAESFELDIENNGNRLVGLIGPMMRGVARWRRQLSKRMHAIKAV